LAFIFLSFPKKLMGIINDLKENLNENIFNFSSLFF